MASLARGVLALGLVAVLLAPAFAAVGDTATHTSPAWVWAHRPYLHPSEDAATRVSYEVLTPQSLAATFLGSVLQPDKDDASAQRYIDLKLLMDSKPDVFVAFMGSQLRTGDIFRLASRGSVKPLQDALVASNSSVAFPYIAREEGTESLASSLLGAFMENGGAGRVAVSAGCTREAVAAADAMPGAEVWAGHEMDGHSLKEFLDSQSGLPGGHTTILLLCSAEETLAEEMRELLAVATALQQSSAHGILLFASEQGPGAPAPNRRGLADWRSYGVEYDCGPGTVCRSQVYVLEGLIVGVVFLIALLSGLCCMGVLEGPSKFEHAEEERAR